MPTRASRSDQKEKKRKTRKRAVLQFRIPEAEYRELAKAAAKSDLTISEEAARRLLDYRTRDREADLAERFMDQSLVKESAETELEKRGHRKVWLTSSEAIFTAPQLEEMLVRAAKLGAELALKDFQK
jgi:hypothetical protein